ncbi:MAG: ABC transporter ATP-binding protein [Pirellulaceae bacterium]
MLVQTLSLCKRYGNVTALDHCSVDVARGEVYGLLGPNGAGKTTLLRLLLGFLRPTHGRATIDGLDTYRHSVRVRKIVAYLPGEVRLFRTMPARGVLRFFADSRADGDLQRSLALAQRFQLDLSRRVAFMSTGMRQKLALAATLAADTPLLILDEPTSYLDPTMRALVMEMVREAKRNGKTVFFSSHVLSEVEEVCDRVAILSGGRLVHTQNMPELRRQHRIHATLQGEMPQAPESLRSQFSMMTGSGGQITLDTFGELAPLLGWLATLPLREMRVEPIGLRAVYDRFHANGLATPDAEDAAS